MTPGLEICVEDTAEGVLLRHVRPLPETRLEDVAALMKYQGVPKSLCAMDEAAAQAVFRVRVWIAKPVLLETALLERCGSRHGLRF